MISEALSQGLLVSLCRHQQYALIQMGDWCMLSGTPISSVKKNGCPSTGFVMLVGWALGQLRAMRRYQ